MRMLGERNEWNLIEGAQGEKRNRNFREMRARRDHSEKQMGEKLVGAKRGREKKC